MTNLRRLLLNPFVILVVIAGLSFLGWFLYATAVNDVPIGGFDGVEIRGAAAAPAIHRIVAGIFA